MQLEKLDHVNVRTTQLDTMITWYTNVLGMQNGFRPNFPFPGAWLYVDASPVVHLVGIEGAPGIGSEKDLKLEHFSLTATGRLEFEAKLERSGVNYQRSDVPDINIIQYNMWDPDGNHIHIDFPATE